MRTGCLIDASSPDDSALSKEAGEAGEAGSACCSLALRLPEILGAVFEHLDTASTKAAMLVCRGWFAPAAELLWRDATVTALRGVRRSSRRLPLYAAAIRILAIPRPEDMDTDLQPWSSLPHLQGLLLNCEYLVEPRAFNSLLGRCNAARLASFEFTNNVWMTGKWKACSLVGGLEVSAVRLSGVPPTSALLRLAQCPVLRELKLSEVVLAHDVVAALAERLSRPFPRLEALAVNVAEPTAVLLLGWVEPTLVSLTLWVREAQVSRSSSDICRPTWAALSRLLLLRHLSVQFIDSMPSPTPDELLGLGRLAQLRALTLWRSFRLGQPPVAAARLAGSEWHALLSRLPQLTALRLGFPLVVSDRLLHIVGELSQELEYLHLEVEYDLTSLEAVTAEQAVTTVDRKGDGRDKLPTVLFPKLLDLYLGTLGDRIAGER